MTYVPKSSFPHRWRRERNENDSMQIADQTPLSPPSPGQVRQDLAAMIPAPPSNGQEAGLSQNCQIVSHIADAHSHFRPPGKVANSLAGKNEIYRAIRT